MNNNVIIALDFENKETTLAFLDQLDQDLKNEINIPKKPYVKVGMELFYFEGPAIIKEIVSRGHPIFLDLKLHDIPNTVFKAMINIARLGVSMVNVHAKGGMKMMMSAHEGLKKGNPKACPLLIAVTELTSTDQEMITKEFRCEKNIIDVVIDWAINANNAGLDGVVCSALEVPILNKKINNPHFRTITPGIRLENESKNDQARVVTPKDAFTFGSSYIVVGRSITNSDNPAKTYVKIFNDFNQI